jgi:hypothetical protein
MSLTTAEIQQALRISKAIENHLENTRAVNVRSEDLYSILADQKLVDRDVEQGKHFRVFLKKLVKANMLNLIPQCHAMPKSGGKYDYTFNRAADRMPARKAVVVAVPEVAVEVATPVAEAIEVQAEVEEKAQ